MRTLIMIFAMALLVTSVAVATNVKEDDPDPVNPGVDVWAPGPDDFGYTVATDCPFTFMDISATGTDVGGGDDVLIGPIMLYSPFNFYGIDYNELYASTNGFIQFAYSTTSDLSNSCPLPDVSDYPRIEVLHDDLDLEAGIGTGYVQYFEVCPQQGRDDDEPCSVGMWYNIAHYPGGPTAPVWHQEVILFHRTGDIVIMVGAGNPETGNSSTTGIQDGSGTDEFCLTIACDSVGSVPDNSCFWILHPNPIAIENISFGAVKALYR